MAVRKSTPKSRTTTPKVLDSAPKVPDSEEEPKALWTVRTIKVDPKTTLRKPVRIGPSVCVVCGYDPVVVNKDKFMTEDYAALDDEGKMVARNLLKKHSERHGPAEYASAKVRNLELTEKLKHRK
jgi:hypothetical protein